MRQIYLILGLFFSLLAFGQEPKVKEYFIEINTTDFSDLWTTDSILAENRNLIERQEPIGFVGDDFQRFYIHFSSVIQNFEKPLEYFVYGKTKVKDKIFSFQGTITIIESKAFDSIEIPIIKQGDVKGKYEFFEDPDQKETGILKGNFESNFIVNEEGELKYDAIFIVADGFNNNQFQGTWTSYKSGESKICNWGDYRIPECNWLNDCDTGAGEFKINDKYLKNGWENYRLAWGTYPETLEVIKAQQKENEKWWIDK